MRGDLFDYLLLLVKSGVRFDQALSFLHDVYPKQHLNKLIDRLYHGETEISVLASLFPWWLPYPFKNISLVIRIDLFLEVYDEYIKMKRSWFNSLSKLLFYPLILLIFSFILLIISVQVIIPFSDMFLSNIDNPYNYNHYFIILMIVFFIQFSCFFYILWVVVRFNTLDFFEVLDVCFKMGWSLHTIILELSFNRHFDHKWKKIKYDTLEKGDFVDAMSTHLNFPDIIQLSLKSYSYSACLSDGISYAKVIYQAYFFRSISFYIKIFQGSIYCVVLCIIFLIISILYKPIVAINTL